MPRKCEMELRPAGQCGASVNKDERKRMGLRSGNPLSHWLVDLCSQVRDSLGSSAFRLMRCCQYDKDQNRTDQVGLKADGRGSIVPSAPGISHSSHSSLTHTHTLGGLLLIDPELSPWFRGYSVPHRGCRLGSGMAAPRCTSEAMR